MPSSPPKIVVLSAVSVPFLVDRTVVVEGSGSVKRSAAKGGLSTSSEVVSEWAERKLTNVSVEGVTVEKGTKEVTCDAAQGDLSISLERVPE